MVSYSPFAILTATSVRPANVLADKAPGLKVRPAPQTKQSGRSFVETLSKAAAQIEKDTKPEPVKNDRFADNEAPAQTAVGQGEAQAAVMQMEAQKSVEQVEDRATAAESGPQEAQIQGAGEEIPLIPHGDPMAVQEMADLAPAKVQESPVQESLVQEASQGKNQAQVFSSHSAENQTSEEKGPFHPVSPAVQQQLADLLQAIENLVGVQLGPETSQPNQLLAENRSLTPGVSTIARFIDEPQQILGLQQLIRQELAKFQDTTEIPQNLAKIKDLINSQLDDKSPAALGELLSSLAETLAQTGLGKQKRPQADITVDGLSSDEDRVMTPTFMFEAKGTRTESGRLNPDIKILREPEGSEEGQTNLNKLPEVGKVSGFASAVAGAGLERSSSTETTANTAVQFTSVSGTDKAEVQPQNMKFLNEAELEARTAAKETSQTGEKQAPVNKMDLGIVNQIAQKVKLSTVAEKNEMQIQLKPEFLGKLDLIVSTENGLVTAKFNTGSVHVKAMIEANLNTLRDALAEQGVRVDQLTVTVNADRDFSGFQHREPAFQQNRFARGNKMTDKETDLEEMLLSSERSLVSRKYHGNTVDFMA